MWGLIGDVITHARFQLNRFRFWGATVPLISRFPIRSDRDRYKLPCYIVEKIAVCAWITRVRDGQICRRFR